MVSPSSFSFFGRRASSQSRQIKQLPGISSFHCYGSEFGLVWGKYTYSGDLERVGQRPALRQGRTAAKHQHVKML